jgi:RNA 3'-terminal phosphate cyclase (ATP)
LWPANAERPSQFILCRSEPFRIEKIRAGRPKPGLLRQHLTAVKAAAAISGASVSEAELGSGSVTFSPGAVIAGEFAFAGSIAGSATLVLQTVLPAPMTAPAPSKLLLEGGTHNPMAPPFEFPAKCFLPLINRMGPTVTVNSSARAFIRRAVVVSTSASSLRHAWHQLN